MSATVEIKNLHKRFGTMVALENINLTIPKGSFVVLLGPSGSGKTTLLNIIGGFLEADAGQIFIGDKDVTQLPPAKRPTATVFQDYALFPHMKVLQNVAFGLTMKGVPRQQREQQAARALELVGLSGFGKRAIHELSGGQKQRIALARSLVVEPEVLLLDEPLGALDLNLRKQMQQELVAIQKRVGTTFVHVTHDQEEAMSIADVIVVMNQGRIEDLGPPERVYLQPASRFSATFMGESNLLEATLIKQEGEKLELATPLGTLMLNGTAPASSFILSLRPEQISTEVDPASIHLGEGVLMEKHFLGTHYYGQFVLGTQKLKVRLPQQSQFIIGQKSSLYAPASSLVILNC